MRQGASYPAAEFSIEAVHDGEHHNQGHYADGNARHGDKSVPQWRGGGKAFGPKPRSYRKAMPKSMRCLALRCVLSAKAGDGELKVLEALKFEEPKTKKMAQALAALGADYSTLIVTSEPEDSVIKSARNLPRIKTAPANLLNVNDLLAYNTLLMTEAAVRKAEQIWGDGQAEGGNDASV